MFAVFDQFELTDPNKIAELEPVTGKIAIQAKYTPIEKSEMDDTDLDKIGNLEDEESEETPPVQIGKLRIKILESRAFEPEISHKLRFYIEGQDEIKVTQSQENTQTPKWSEAFVFSVFGPRKGEDFPQIVVEDIDAKADDKILHSTKAEFGLIAKKEKGKIEKWCAFFNKTKKQVKLALFYRQLDK
jgi:hypothetical protein